jgi:hypothetical protein
LGYRESTTLGIPPGRKDAVVIEKLMQSDSSAFGLKLEGEVSAEQIREFAPQIEFVMGQRGHRKIGILVDLSSSDETEWGAHWEEIQFLRKYSGHIERIAVVGSGAWEELATEILGGTVLISVETRYYRIDELQHAWHWVKHGEHPDSLPVRKIFPKEDGLMGGYDPRYLDV